MSLSRKNSCENRRHCSPPTPNRQSITKPVFHDLKATYYNSYKTKIRTNVFHKEGFSLENAPMTESYCESHCQRDDQSDRIKEELKHLVYLFEGDYDYLWFQYMDLLKRTVINQIKNIGNGKWLNMIEIIKVAYAIIEYYRVYRYLLCNSFSVYPKQRGRSYSVINIDFTEVVEKYYKEKYELKKVLQYYRNRYKKIIMSNEGTIEMLQQQLDNLLVMRLDKYQAEEIKMREMQEIINEKYEEMKNYEREIYLLKYEIGRCKAHISALEYYLQNRNDIMYVESYDRDDSYDSYDLLYIKSYQIPSCGNHHTSQCTQRSLTSVKMIHNLPEEEQKKLYKKEIVNKYQVKQVISRDKAIQMYNRYSYYADYLYRMLLLQADTLEYPLRGKHSRR